MEKKQSDNTGYWSDEMKKDFVNAPHWSMERWVSVLEKGGGQNRRFQYCLNPNYPHFLCFRAIQGHSGEACSGNAPIDPALQRNVLVTKGFHQICISHRKRKRKEIISEQRTDTRWFQHCDGQASRIFTIVNPMDDNQDGIGETLCDLSQARIAPYKNTWKLLSGYSILVQFEARSKKRTAILSNNSKRSSSRRHMACRVH